MANIKREQFTLNHANPRDKVIIDFLQAQYDKSDFIKNLLYEYIVSNNLQIVPQIIHKVDSNVTQPIFKDSVSLDVDIHNNDVIVAKDTCKNTTIVTQTKRKDDVTFDEDIHKNNANVTQDFSIDLSSIEDEEVNITTDVEKEDATANAMNFLSQM